MNASYSFRDEIGNINCFQFAADGLFVTARQGICHYELRQVGFVHIINSRT
jgi:hypothetical protein